jgi:hypothetical protein
MELEKLVEAWAEQAGFEVGPGYITTPVCKGRPCIEAELRALCRLAMAHAAEEAAKVVQEYPHWLGQQAKADVIAAIRERFKA